MKTPEAAAGHPAHLREGVAPIVACVGTTPEHLEGKPYATAEDFTILGEGKDAANISIFANKEAMTTSNLKNAGEGTYVISSIDDGSKFAQGYYDCTGIIATGIEKGTGRNISLLTHQDPERFLTDKFPDFFNDLGRSLRELKERCEESTIDAVIVGGDASNDHARTQYDAGISFLDQIIEKELGFRPEKVIGPKSEKETGSDDVFFDTEHKRLYFFRESTTQ
ncbi:MAG: hypothetical protein WCG97_02885 [bacterium]